MPAQPNLSLSFSARDLLRTLSFPGLTFEIQKYSFSVDGGPKLLSIRATGDELALEALFDALRGEVKVWGGGADPLWWGCLWSVTIHNGSFSYGYTLDGMANSIDIKYLQQTVNQSMGGAGISTNAGFAADAASVAEYGTIQKRLTGNNGSAVAAASRQARELANRKAPQQVVNYSGGGGSGAVFADLVCKGWMDTLDWIFYTNLLGTAAGFESNEVLTAEVQQPLGRAHPAYTGIRFNATHNMTNTPSLWSVGLGDYVYFTGTTGGLNNKAWLITVVNSAGGNLDVSPATVVTQAAGPAVVTHQVGTKIYQTFTLTTNAPFWAAALDIRLRKASLLALDDVVIKLYVDAAGLPGALLATATIADADIKTFIGWNTGVLDSVNLLAYGTTYGIEISRSGGESLDCFYVGLDTLVSYAGGTLKLYAGATLGWLSRPVPADLIFRVAGTVETSQQVVNMIALLGSLITAVSVETASGLLAPPYQDGSLTALQVIHNLADYGTVNGRRLLMRVTVERILVLYEEAVYNTQADLLINPDGLPRNTTQQLLSPEACPYSQWAEVAPLVFYAAGQKFVFIDEAEYDHRAHRWTITRLRNRANPLNLTGIKK